VSDFDRLKKLLAAATDDILHKCSAKTKIETKNRFEIKPETYTNIFKGGE